MLEVVKVVYRFNDPSFIYPSTTKLESQPVLMFGIDRFIETIINIQYSTYVWPLFFLWVQEKLEQEGNRNLIEMEKKLDRRSISLQSTVDI